MGGICFACVILVGFKFASLWGLCMVLMICRRLALRLLWRGLESFVFVLGCCLDVAGLDLSLVVVVWLL